MNFIENLIYKQTDKEAHDLSKKVMDLLLPRVLANNVMSYVGEYEPDNYIVQPKDDITIQRQEEYILRKITCKNDNETAEKKVIRIMKHLTYLINQFNRYRITMDDYHFYMHMIPDITPRMVRASMNMVNTPENDAEPTFYFSDNDDSDSDFSDNDE